MRLSYTVNSEVYKTVKEVLKVEFSMSDRLVLKLKKMQRIYLNNNVTYVSQSVKLGDFIECDLTYAEDNSNIVPTQMPLSILYEDDAYLVINKPSGIPVHPSMEHYTNSLSNGVRFYFDKIGLNKKIRPVNRLDKDTSGIVIFAKNEFVQEALVKQMKTKEFVKKYIAIINGNMRNKNGTIDAPIARKESSIIERHVSPSGDRSITHYKVLNKADINNLLHHTNNDCFETFETNSSFEVVECTLETGRTHQIRVHFAHIGHSLLGDTLYGTSCDLISRQALHAYKVEFIHPITKKVVKYKASIPNDMVTILKKIISQEKR